MGIFDISRKLISAFVIFAKHCYFERMNSADILSKLKGDETVKSLGVETLRLFGSVARGTAGDDSDLDFLVRFNGVPTFDRFMDLKLYLEHKLGKKVDLVTEDALRIEMRKSVEKEALLVA
jgi:uncharacterized protein